MSEVADEFLEHNGVKGMKWGVRHETATGATKHTDRLAKKDAKRHVDAKMFYGKGAGTRRKLLKAELEKKKTNVPGYKEAFDHHVNNVDAAKSAKKAVRVRTRKDVTNRTRITTKQFLNVTGPLSVAAGGVIYAKNKPAIDNFIIKNGSKLMSEATKLIK